MSTFYYSPIRFMPYRDSGEFINVGVIVLDIDSKRITYQDMPINRLERISNFFPLLDLEIYKNAIFYTIKEIFRIEKFIESCSDEEACSIFENISSPKEGIIKFGSIRILFSKKECRTVCSELFYRYVARYIKSIPSESVSEFSCPICNIGEMHYTIIEYDAYLKNTRIKIPNVKVSQCNSCYEMAIGPDGANTVDTGIENFKKSHHQ